MEFKVFENETGKILKEYWLTQSEWDSLDKTTVQEGDIYHIVGTIDKGDLSADVNASLAKGDSSLQKPTATLAKESFVKVGIDGSQKFDESSYVIAPSTDGTAGQVLKKTANGTEWADESGGTKIYKHSLQLVALPGTNNPNLSDITFYSTRQSEYSISELSSYIEGCTASYITSNDKSYITKINTASWISSENFMEVYYVSAESTEPQIRSYSSINFYLVTEL